MYDTTVKVVYSSQCTVYSTVIIPLLFIAVYGTVLNAQLTVHTIQCKCKVYSAAYSEHWTVYIISLQ